MASWKNFEKNHNVCNYSFLYFQIYNPSIEFFM